MPPTTHFEGTRAGESTGETRQVPRALMVQSLHRAAGNRAVGSWLGEGPPEIQRLDFGKRSPGGRGLFGLGKGSKKDTAPSPTATTPAPTVWTADDMKGLLKRSSTTVVKLLAGKDTKNGVTLVKGAAGWNKVVSGLPSGKRMNSETKNALFAIVESEALTIDDEAVLFKKRFSADLKSGIDTNKADWTLENVTRVWKQLDLLPDSDVTENSKVAVFYAVTGGGGMYSDDAGAIDLGEDSDESHMSHTVRHEVGHGVHNQLKGTVDSWLKDDIGMWPGSLTSDAGVDEFVKALGGYPEKYTDSAGDEKTVGEEEKKAVRADIGSYTNNTAWGPTRTDPENTGDPGIWSQMVDVKKACKESKAQWYDNFENFVAGAGGNFYFVNHWYHTWFRMSPRAKEVVRTTGENYTAMSEAELFANAYAEYFKDAKGKQDPKFWGGALDEKTQSFFRTCIVARDPWKKYVKDQKKKKTNK